MFSVDPPSFIFLGDQVRYIEPDATHFRMPQNSQHSSLLSYVCTLGVETGCRIAALILGAWSTWP